MLCVLCWTVLSCLVHAGLRSAQVAQLCTTMCEKGPQYVLVAFVVLCGLIVGTRLSCGRHMG
jgi:hypothetical protein